jgi:RNA polymerase sigma-70 factor (ECF subfamily)
MEHLDDEQLLSLTPDRPEAFAVFYRRHERALLGVFIRRAGDPEIAADLAAETFAAALDSLPRYDRSRGPALAWVFGIARNKLLHARDAGRVEDAARRRLGLPGIVHEDEAVECIERLGGDERVTAWLEQLPADQADAVRARILDEETYGRIAARVKCSESVVRQRVSRGLGRLRSIVKESS